MIVPFISCLAAQEFFRLCEPLNRFRASLGDGGFRVSFSYVVCRERALRGVPGCEGDVVGIAGEAADVRVCIAVGLVCSKKDCWLVLDETPVVAEAAELVNTASGEDDKFEESERAARSGSIYAK
jgi:hypothetical protein